MYPLSTKHVTVIINVISCSNIATYTMHVLDMYKCCVGGAEHPPKKFMNRNFVSSAA